MVDIKSETNLLIRKITRQTREELKLAMQNVIEMQMIANEDEKEEHNFILNDMNNEQLMLVRAFIASFY